MKPQPVSFLSQKNWNQNIEFHKVSRETVLLANFMQKRPLFSAQFHWNSGSYFEFHGDFWNWSETATSFIWVLKAMYPFKIQKKLSEIFAKKIFFWTKSVRVSKKAICV